MGFDRLPIEIVVEILAHVPSLDLLQASQVCREWNTLLPPSYHHHNQDKGGEWFEITTNTTNVDETTGRFARESSQLWDYWLNLENMQENGITVWKRRAEIYFHSWISLLPPGCDFRWLCLAHDHHPTEMKDTKFSEGKFSGLGHNTTISHRVNYDVISEYVGEFRDGKFHGSGILRLKNSRDFQFYTGTWQFGRQHGIGKFVWTDDQNVSVPGNSESTNNCQRFYLGQCKNGMRHGFGQYQWDENRKYVGYYKFDQLCGNGIFTCKAGTIDGEWQANKKHGLCTIMWPGGLPKFVGNYDRGRRIGNGTYYWSDGAVFVGEWNGSNRHGHGVMKFSNKLIFEGEYFDDLRHGHGKLIWTDTGDTFEGTWNRGARRGRGIFTNGQTGEQTAQVWYEDVNVKYASESGAARWP